MLPSRSRNTWLVVCLLIEHIIVVWLLLCARYKVCSPLGNGTFKCSLPVACLSNIGQYFYNYSEQLVYESRERGGGLAYFNKTARLAWSQSKLVCRRGICEESKWPSWYHDLCLVLFCLQCCIASLAGKLLQSLVLQPYNMSGPEERNRALSNSNNCPHKLLHLWSQSSS